VVVVEVVVVTGVTGFSTTVVHELRTNATATSGVRMISFFIVEVVSFY
jgi:ribosomal protein L10